MTPISAKPARPAAIAIPAFIASVSSEGTLGLVAVALGVGAEDVESAMLKFVVGELIGLPVWVGEGEDDKVDVKAAEVVESLEIVLEDDPRDIVEVVSSAKTIGEPVMPSKDGGSRDKIATVIRVVHGNLTDAGSSQTLIRALNTQWKYWSSANGILALRRSMSAQEQAIRRRKKINLAIPLSCMTTLPMVL
jgi:hypothetical protein